MLERVFFEVSENWPNLAAILAVVAGLFVAIHLIKKRDLKALKDKTYVKRLDRNYGIIAIAALLWPVAGFVFNSRSNASSIAMSDALFLAAGAFLMLGGFYPIAFAIKVKRSTPEGFVESTELAANYWAFLAILLALAFTFSGTLALTDDNHRREARLFDLRLDDVKLGRASKAHEDDIAKLSEQVDQQRNQFTDLKSTVDGLPNDIKTLGDAMAKIRLNLDGIQKEQERRLSDLAGKVNDLCRAIEKLQLAPSGGRQKATPKPLLCSS
jgi:hypothetical protein